MTCLHKPIVDDLIQAFMHIVNYKPRLTVGSIGECLDSTSLKLKASAKYGIPNLLAKAMKSYPRVEGLNTMDFALEGS